MIKFFHKSRLIALSLLLLSGTLTGCKTPQEEKGEYFGYTKQTEENNVAGEYSDGLAYYVSRDHKEAAVGYGDCKDTDVVLPSTYRGIPITGIIGPRSQAQSIDSNVADDAFAGQNITSVTFGNAVTSIGAQAFLNTPLTSVEIPAGVTDLKTGTFQQCTKLTNVTFAENSQLETIGDNCFEGDTSLLAGGALAFPDRLVSIGAGAFSRCTKFSSISFPGPNTTKETTGLQTIGPAAFAYCSNLSQIYFSSSITSIGDYAFLGLPDGLTWGTSVARGSGAKTLALSPFNRETGNGNNGLWNLIAYDSVNRKSVYLSMTWNNGDIKGTDDFIYTQAGDGSINIIRYEPILAHQSYTRVCVPQSIGAGTTVKTISADAFTNYKNTLTMIALPKTLTALPQKMFNDAAYNTHLTALFVPDIDLDPTVESQWTPFNNTLDLSRSTSLTEIGAQCFGGAEKSDLEWPNITSVSLPKTLRHIYNWGLRGFYNVNSLTFQDPYTCPSEGNYPLALPTTREEMLAQYLYCYRGSFQNMGKNATSTSPLRFPANIFFYDNNNGYHFSDCNFISDLIFQERNYYYDLEHSQSDKGEVFFQIPKNCFNSCRNIKSITTLNVDGTVSDYSFPNRVFASDYAFAHVGISWNGTKPITSNKYPGLHRIYLGPDYYNGNFSSLAFAGVSGLTVYLDGVQSNSKKFNNNSSFDLSSTSNRERIDGTTVKMPLYQDVKLLKNGAVDDQHSYLLQYTHEGCTYDFVTDKTKTNDNWNVTLTRCYYDTTLDAPPTVAKVPSTFTKDGKTFQVTKIGDNAFYRSCRFQATKANTGLATVELPDTIKEIGAYAFAFTETLTRITTNASDATNYNLPGNLTNIGAKAFFYTHLYKVKLNASLKTLATGDNNYGNGLLGATNYAYTTSGVDTQNPVYTIYDIGDNTSFIKTTDGVIYENKNKKVGGKDAYKAIGYDANGQGDNATVNVGSGLGEGKICDEVAPRAFAQQTNIQTVVFAQTVTKIGNAAFQPLIRSNSSNRYENNVASNITTVSWETAPNTTVTLGEYSFANCTKMTSFGLPSTVTKIPNYCFYNAKLCEWSNTAFHNITEIKQSAFKLGSKDDSNKGPVYLDLSSATKVEASAFENCSDVKTIDFGQRTKSKTDIAAATTGVEMGENCFKNCLSKDGSTTSVFIPKSSLAKGKPFDGCSQLADIYLCEFTPAREGWSSTWNNNGNKDIDVKYYKEDGQRPDGNAQTLWWYADDGEIEISLPA